MGLIIKHYTSSQYTLLFNNLNGFMVRIGKSSINPSYNCEAPELLDISITNYCELACSYCYRKSDKTGHHMPLDKYHSLIKNAANAGVVQVALGGGNPNQHPDFIDILKITTQYGIIPSYSTNGYGITKEIIDATKKYCGAVAISHHENMSGLIKLARQFMDKGIKTNLHYILDAKTIYLAIKTLQFTPELWNEFNAVIFLNMKPVEINKANLLQNTSQDALNCFFSLIKREYKFKIGFDSCMISFLVRQGFDNASSSIESCEAAKFSAFVSEDMKMYPCSFMINEIDGCSLNNKTINDIWVNDDAFLKMRNRSCRCLCEYWDLCMGGCPIYNINNRSCSNSN